MAHTRVQSDELAVTTLLDQTIAAFNSGDIDKAVSFHTENVVLMEANMPAVNGREELRKLFTEIFEKFKQQNITVKLAFTILELEVVCHRAFVRGEVVLIKTKKGADPIHIKGKFISLFQKQPDGSWLRSHIISNPDAPDSNFSA